MKKSEWYAFSLISVLLICISANANFFDQVIQMLPDQKIQTAFAHQPSTFGKKHFIIGYDKSADSSSTPEVNISTNTAHDIPDVFFTPDDSIRQTLINFINQEQECIQIATFVFTEKNIAQALLDASKRGIHIEVVTDSACLRDRANKIGLLCQNNITVYIYDPSMSKANISTCMHHKFIIFRKNSENRKLVWTGSFNFTRAASETNQENALILDDKKVIEKFSNQFERLKRRAYRYGR